MITAMDTLGSVWISLLQVNTNTQVMEMYMTHLMQTLDKQRKNWRSNTIILMDGAPYHTSEVMMEFFEDFQVPIMLTGPH